MTLDNTPAAAVQATTDSGFSCLVTIAGFHGITADINQLRHEHGHAAPGLDTLRLAAKGLGLTTRAVLQDPTRLAKAPLPAIAQDRNGAYFIVGKFDAAATPSSNNQPAEPRLLILRPGAAPTVMRLSELLATWSGTLILLTSKASFAGAVAKFDFTWFIPALVKYRGMLAEVLLLSLVLQCIGLAVPMFFQVVMDKVLVNHAMQTLDVIAVGLIAAVFFEVVLGAIRSYTMSNASSKIDVELGARLFRHLLHLPLSYFHVRRVGDSVARVRELENIRSFLTGSALSILLDVVFSVVFFLVMFFYSPLLTLVVALTIPLYLMVSLLFTPVLRRRLNEKFNRGAENQSFLVETISGIDTVKAMAVEPGWQHKWEKQLAGYIAAGLATVNVATVANSAVQLISKLTTGVVMWVGATLVIAGKLSVGELIAFNMLAGQVSGPVLRLAQFWSDFQQVGISVDRLGDILNARTETDGNKTALPPLAGQVEFDQVSFRFRPEASDVLRQVSLKIGAGEVIGIVGRSGSGKSTLTKLVQKLYLADRGRVLIDGCDLALADAASLRNQIGVVLQENFLFARSIRDNIALANPALPLERVIAAAKLAGAHDFICALPEGYDTLVGEHGTGLSGGQRQRIAIARALVSNPRILIFDEATSALDYESEKVIQDNMRKICAGRTVLIIAHRLSAVRDAHRIVVMESGQIAESGTHAELLARPNGIYRHLCRLQSGGSAEHMSPVEEAA